MESLCKHLDLYVIDKQRDKKAFDELIRKDAYSELSLNLNSFWTKQLRVSKLQHKHNKATEFEKSNLEKWLENLNLDVLNTAQPKVQNETRDVSHERQYGDKVHTPERVSKGTENPKADEETSEMAVGSDPSDWSLSYSPQVSVYIIHLL